MEEPKKKTISEYITMMREAWTDGVEIGNDLNESKKIQRKIIAERVKEKRVEKGYSQEQLSTMIHANNLTYKGYENCKSDIPIVYLVRLANKLETTVDYLTGRVDEVNRTPEEAIAIEERLERLEKKVFSEK